MLTLEPLPMAEAQQFWRDKVPMGYGEFTKLSDEAKVKAIAISGIAKGDELNTVVAALQKAIDQGTSLEAFKADCAEIFERRGWTGKRDWRIDNIFRTNIQTAYNVGQYKQLMEDKAIFPIWQYSAINDSRTRPTHRAMDGRAWPANHPMWDVWFPPNGYRCRCSVIGLTAKQAERRGIKVEDVDPTNTLVEPIDPLTGNRMPARQLLPDPGFNISPGKVVYGGLADVLGEKLATLPAAIASQILDEVSGPLAVVDDALFAQWMDEILANTTAEGVVKTTGELREVGFIYPKIAEALQQAAGIDLTTVLITISDRQAMHTLHLGESARANDRILGVDDLKRLPAHLRQPQAVLYDRSEGGLIYVFAGTADDVRGKWAVRLNLLEKKAHRITNSVRTGAYVQISDLKGEQYMLLHGSL